MNKKEDYSQIKYYISEMKKLDENEALFLRYAGKVYYASIDCENVDDRHFQKICKSLKKLKLGNAMKTFMEVFVCKMMMERIKPIDGELRIGHIFSEDTLNAIEDEKMKESLSLDAFYESKNILVTRGQRL